MVGNPANFLPWRNGGETLQIRVGQFIPPCRGIHQPQGEVRKKHPLCNETAALTGGIDRGTKARS
jgi:hypothetical protein